MKVGRIYFGRAMTADELQQRTLDNLAIATAKAAPAEVVRRNRLDLDLRDVLTCPQ